MTPALRLAMACATVAATLAVAAPARAQAEDPTLFWSSDLKARIEPLGLIWENQLRWRDVYRRDGSLLFDGVYREVGIDLALSPAIAELGAHVEWLPIKVFSLRAEYRVLTSFGTLGYMLSFPTADSPYGEEEEELLEGQEETGIGHRVSIMPTVQLAAGPIIVRNLTEWHMSWFGSYDGPYVRERLYDQLQASDGDWLLVNTSVLAYALWDPEGDGLAIIGPYYEHVVTGDSGTGRQRVGGVAAWIDGQTRGEIRRLRVYLQSGVNLDDRNRDGAFFVQGGAGFDFWLRAQ